MGIPYSHQISLAFTQVSPLVAHGFKVLQTTRNITYLLAAIQIFTVVLLMGILVVGAALLVCVAPGLEREAEGVGVGVKYLIHTAIGWGWWLRVGMWTIGVGAGIGTVAGWWVMKDEVVEDEDEDGEEKEGDAG